MNPTFVPKLVEPSLSPDVVIVGAGAAGIAAARSCLAAGATVALLEAREHVGGRAVTVALDGHPIDLGAHWLHAGATNPLVKLARATDEPLRRTGNAPRQLFVPGRRATAAEKQAYDDAWGAAEDAYRTFAGPDRAFADVLPPLGSWRGAIESSEVLLSGRPLAEVSFLDQPGDELYEENHFISGGYGAYLARLANGLPARIGCPVLAIDWSRPTIEVATPQDIFRARAVIVTVPSGVLKAGNLRFEPALPRDVEERIACFLPGTYEHVVLHWPGAPFEGSDRFATLVGGGYGAVSLLTRIDGSDLHYMELDHRMADDAPSPDARRRLALLLLGAFFSADELRTCRPLYATDWRGDPWSLGAWGVLPPGAHGAREALRRPVGRRIWFAGEALSRAQAGTVGGAWEQGERAAAEIMGGLR